MSIQLSLERQLIYTWFFLKERSNNGDLFDYYGQNLKKTASSDKKSIGFVNDLLRFAKYSKSYRPNQEILDFLKK